jgi:hypothetical protein
MVQMNNKADKTYIFYTIKVIENYNFRIKITCQNMERKMPTFQMEKKKIFSARVIYQN